MTRCIPYGVLLVAVVTIHASPARAQDGSDLNMQAIAQALGVQCSYCHARGGADPLLDYVSDENPKKAIARQMIAMTRDINAKVQVASGKAAADATRVDCVTCHRGNAVPTRLVNVLARTLRDKGVEAAVAEYRELRQKFYGRDTYDFTETEVLNLAMRLASSRPDDTIALMTMNLEFNPRSARSHIVLSRAYTRKRDDVMVLEHLQKALEIEPENPMAKGYLYQLEQDRRR